MCSVAFNAQSGKPNYRQDGEVVTACVAPEAIRLGE